MKINALLESEQNILLERHMRRGRWLVESATAGMTPLQRKVVEGIYKDLTPLIEASISHDQIKDLFGEIEKQVSAGGQNRTALGKAKDAGVETAKQAKEVIDSIGGWLKNTAPVKGFDNKFKSLKDQINKKFPDSKLLDAVSEMGIWAEKNPGKTAAIIGVLTAVAALAAGPVGGAIAGQILRGSKELLTGADLSTALGKGLKTAALGATIGAVSDFMQDTLGSYVSTEGTFYVNGQEVSQEEYSQHMKSKGFSDPMNPTADELEKATGKQLPDNVESQIGQQGELPQPKPGGFADTVEKTSDAQRAEKGLPGAGVKATDYAADNEVDTDAPASPQSGTQQGITADQIKNHPEYKAEIERSGNDVEGRRAASLKARAAIMKGESVYRQTRPLSEGQIYLLFDRVVQHNVRLINEGVVVTNRLNEGPMDFLKKAAGKAVGKLSSVGKNLTTKVTADKLLSAWKKSKSPDEPAELKSFLTTQGVAPEVISAAFQSMSIQEPTGQAAQPADQNNTAGDQEETDTAVDQQGTDAAPAATKPEKDQEVEFDGTKYRWLGAQWAEVNSNTNKAGKMAEKGIVPELNKLAAGQSQQSTAQNTQQPTSGKGGNFDSKHGVPLSPKGAEMFSKMPPEQQKKSIDSAKAAGFTVDPQTNVWSSSADSEETSTDGADQDKAAPAGTIGLAQQGEKPATATPASGKSSGGQTASASPVDPFRLAKEIKQLKPEVINAVKKLLTSREAQRAL